jgi:hypothetical protein
MSTRSINHDTPLLQRILEIFIKNDSKEDQKEMKRYDNIKFEDVNKEVIKSDKQSKSQQKEKLFI